MSDDYEVHEVSSPTSPSHRWLVVAVILLFAACLGSAFCIVQQQREARQMAAGYDQMSVALNQTRSQLDAAMARINALSAPPAVAPSQAQIAPPPTEETAPAKAQRSRHIQRKAHERSAEDDPRWKKVQAELDEHQKQLDATRQDLSHARTDMESKLTSTRDDLNGSIARTHADVVALQKRGEKNYTEFNLAKSKDYNHVGPLSISLRKADSKHLFCDLKLIVDDNEITKKHVNLFEPVLLYPADYAHPVEIVINQIDKNQARGYVSAPKFRLSELAAATGSETAASPISSTASTSTASLEHRPAPSPQ